MICILEVSLIRPATMSQPSKALQHCFELQWLPDKTTAGRFLAGLLYRTENWLNEVRLEKHEELMARGRATLPPAETSLTLIEVEKMCSHHGLARIKGDDFATFYLEWLLVDEGPATFELGRWLRDYEEHQSGCAQSLLPLPPEPETTPVPAPWPAPLLVEQPYTPPS